MSGLFTIRRTKGGRTHYVASVIPKTTVIDSFTDDPAKALRLKEDDAKAVWEAIAGDPTRYGQWSVVDVDGREADPVVVHPTPEPKRPRVADVTAKVAGPSVTPTPPADALLFAEPDHSPFRELAFALFYEGPDPSDPSSLDMGDLGVTLGQVAGRAAAEIKALREMVDDLTKPAAEGGDLKAVGYDTDGQLKPLDRLTTGENK